MGFERRETDAEGTPRVCYRNPVENRTGHNTAQLVPGAVTSQIRQSLWPCGKSL